MENTTEDNPNKKDLDLDKESDTSRLLINHLNEIKELTNSVNSAIQKIHLERSFEKKIEDSINEVRNIQQNINSISREGSYMIESGNKCECGGSCLSNDCCQFDIIMTHVRVLAMQPLELDDSNINPWGEMEIKMFAYLDGGIGTIIPSMFSTLTVRKLIQYPGLKVGINRIIGTVTVQKNKAKTITIGVDAIEEDSGLIERATGGRDEEGSNSSTMILDCCCCSPTAITFDVNFTSGGQGAGAIEVGFTAQKK